MNYQKILKKAFWFISISRNAVIVLISSIAAFWFQSNGYSPFVLSGKCQFQIVANFAFWFESNAYSPFLFYQVNVSFKLLLILLSGLNLMPILHLYFIR